MRIVAAAAFAAAAVASTAAVAAECLPQPDLAQNAITISGCDRVIYGRGGDVRLNLGDCTGRITVRDARRVHVLGGSIKLGKLEPAALTFINIKESATVEGVHIDGGFNAADGIRIHTSPGALLEVVNTRVERIGGRQQGPHGDVTHTQGKGPLRALRMQNVTGLTGYQGVFSPWREPRHGSTGADRISLERVNLSDYPRGTPGADNRDLWILHVGEVNPRPNQYGQKDHVSPNGTFFDEVYVNSSPGKRVWNARIRPVPAGIAGGCATFPAAAKVDGKVCGGKPPGGDFAPVERVGANYERSWFCGEIEAKPDFVIEEGEFRLHVPEPRARILFGRLAEYLNQ